MRAHCIVRTRRNPALHSARCVSWRAEERPGLGSQVLPELSRLAGAAEALAAHPATSAGPPSMLLCPITQDVFEDPVIAADGHTCGAPSGPAPSPVYVSLFLHLQDPWEPQRLLN